MSKYTFKGRVWVLTDSEDRLIPDIDTDQIFHNAYLHITDINEMGQYAFDNLEGWEDFAKKAEEGDMIIAGSNFGAGSSRQHAVDCFTALGVKLIIAESYGAIYKRNAINSGFPILTASEMEKFVADGIVKNGDTIAVDLLAGELRVDGRDEVIRIEPFSVVQKDIYEKGSLFSI